MGLPDPYAKWHGREFTTPPAAATPHGTTAGRANDFAVAAGDFYWVVDVNRVDLDDILRLKGKPGIVRVQGDPHTAVMAIPLRDGPWDFVAGMSSENV